MGRCRPYAGEKPTVNTPIVGGHGSCQTPGVPSEHLIATKPDAPWLPEGSTAEVWAVRNGRVPDPCIIVRLLLLRQLASGVAEFFCVPTHRGLDLPTLSLVTDPTPMTPTEGLAELAEHTVGRAGVTGRCIGYVRNVVPHPDASYPHPTPWAHVPVFVPTEPVEPVAEGSWVTLDSARADLSVRHWWPIVEHHLTCSRTH